MEKNLLLARQTISGVPVNLQSQQNGFHSHDLKLQPKSLNPTSRWKLHLLNGLGIVYIVVYSLISISLGIKLTIPDMYVHDEDTLFNRQLLAIILVIILFLNYILMLLRSTASIVRSSTASLPLFDPRLHQWKYCDTCMLHTPPRAKHCPVCNHCVLKRDHHCFFSGCCIGFHNQRFFLVFCFYGCLLTLYSIYTSGCFLQEHYAIFFSSEMYAYLLPCVLWKWLSGSVGVGTMGLVVHCYLSCSTFIASCYFFTGQCILAWTGQSTYEWFKGIKLYRQPVAENLKSIFGPLWFLNFVIPCPWMKNKGNGIDWIVSHDEKDK